MIEVLAEGIKYRFLGDEVEMLSDELVEKVKADKNKYFLLNDLFEWLADQGWTPPPHARVPIAPAKPVNQILVEQLFGKGAKVTAIKPIKKGDFLTDENVRFDHD